MSTATATVKFSATATEASKTPARESAAKANGPRVIGRGPEGDPTYTKGRARQLARLCHHLALLTLEKWQWWRAQVDHTPIHRHTDQYERSRVSRVDFIEDKVFRLSATELKVGWAAIKRIYDEHWAVDREIKTAKAG